MRKINVFEWREKGQNKRYVVEIKVVRLYLNIVLTPQIYLFKKGVKILMNFVLGKLYLFFFFNPFQHFSCTSIHFLFEWRKKKEWLLHTRIDHFAFGLKNVMINVSVMSDIKNFLRADILHPSTHVKTTLVKTIKRSTCFIVFFFCA